MSLYKRPESGTYAYDFRLGGHRFSGRTGATTRRAAELVEKEAKARAKAALAEEANLNAPSTFGHAVTRYWREVGEHHKNAGTTLEYLEWLSAEIGTSRALAEIDDNLVAWLVAKKRQQKDSRYKDQSKAPKISNRTVNAAVTEMLRKVMRRARKIWKARVQEINWTEHMLKVGSGRVREATPDEERKVLSNLARGYDDAVVFALLNGVRRMEILGLRWRDVDFFNRRFKVTGKADKSRMIPMSQATYNLLMSVRQHHPEVVFTYAAARTRRYGDRLLQRGKRYPLTDAGLKSAFKRAVGKTDVKDFHFHDTRHTMASRVTRATKDLLAVKELLGHARLTTTQIYTHAMEEDLRSALEVTQSHTGMTTGTNDGEVKGLNRKEKSV